MNVIFVSFEFDQVVIAMPGKVNHVRSELRKTVEEVVDGRGRSRIDFYQVAVHSGLDHPSDYLQLPPDT